VSRDQILFAPIQGVTNEIFRHAFHKVFTGVDKHFAPFIRVHQGRRTHKGLRNYLSRFNPSMPVVPQILSNAAGEFLALDEELAGLGYPEMNWNLGCPFRVVTSKKRGSGRLPHPERIRAILEQIMPKLNCGLSIKLRLGLNSPDEILALIPVLNDFPLRALIVHLRVGSQQYRGEVNLERFADCLRLSRHPVAYNGDIFNQASFQSLKARFPGVQAWMLGRGILANPFLPEQIQGLGADSDRLGRVVRLHEAYAGGLAGTLPGRDSCVDRLREFWAYLHFLFEEGRDFYKHLAKIKHWAEYRSCVQQFFLQNPTMHEHLQVCSEDFH